MKGQDGNPDRVTRGGDLNPRVCPMCEGAVTPDAPTAPFCSERCRMADLGRWFGGDYVISRRLEERDLEETE